MTDARLPDRWLTDEDLVDLTPTAWRFFTFALMLSNSLGTDGHLTERQMRFLHIDVSKQDISDLIVTGRLERVSDGYQFQDWHTKLGQSSAASVETRRELNRQRQAKHRQGKKQPEDAEPVPTDVTHDVTRDAVGQDRKGKDRPGQEEHTPVRTHAGWATIAPGHPLDDKEPWSA